MPTPVSALLHAATKKIFILFLKQLLNFIIVYFIYSLLLFHPSLSSCSPSVEWEAFPSSQHVSHCIYMSMSFFTVKKNIFYKIEKVASLREEA